MTKRYEFGRTLGALDGRNPCYAEDISFACGTFLYFLECFWTHDDSAHCDGNPMRIALFRYVNHMRLACGIEVSKFAHSCAVVM
jgi:hypothetical protein